MRNKREKGTITCCGDHHSVWSDHITMLTVFNCLIVFTFLVRNSLAFNTDIFSGNFDDELWIFSNFPTLDASNISEQCVKDTRRQLTALRHGLPWATKSKLTYLLNILLTKVKLIHVFFIFSFQCTSLQGR